MERLMWEEFRKILYDVHTKYGLDGFEGLVEPAEVVFAACKFFSLEKEELSKFLKTEQSIETYDCLRILVESELQMYSALPKFDFAEMRDAFACDFEYINRITADLWIGVSFSKYLNSFENLTPKYISRMEYESLRSILERIKHDHLLHNLNLYKIFNRMNENEKDEVGIIRIFSMDEYEKIGCNENFLEWIGIFFVIQIAGCLFYKGVYNVNSIMNYYLNYSKILKQKQIYD